MTNGWLLNRMNERKLEWMSSFIAACLLFLGQLIAIHAERTQGVPPWLDSMRQADAGVCLIALLLLLALKKQSSRALTVGTFVAILLPTYAIDYFYTLEVVRLHSLDAALIRPKLFFLALSILVPGPYWINVFLMAGVTLRVLIFWLTAGADTRTFLIQSLEPWATVLYALVGATLLVFRNHYQKIHQELALLQAREGLAKDIAHVFLSIRDLANTPLQSLEIAAAILQRDKVAHQTVVDSIKQAVHKLNMLNRIFKHYEDRVTTGGEKLMSEEEIRCYLAGLESQLNKMSAT